MLKLTLQDDYATTEDLLLALEHIVSLLGQGCTSGYYPTWELTGKAEELECASEGADACTILPGEEECRVCGA